MTQKEIRLQELGYSQYGIYSSMCEAKREAKRLRKCGYAATVYTEIFGDSFFFVAWAKNAGNEKQGSLEIEEVC